MEMLIEFVRDIVRETVADGVRHALPDWTPSAREAEVEAILQELSFEEALGIFRRALK